MTDSMYDFIEELQEGHQNLRNEVEDSWRFMYGTPFLQRLLKTVNGHSGGTYKYRNDPKTLRTYSTGDVYQVYKPGLIKPEVRAILNPLFRDRMVVDLGCGLWGDGYALADSLGAKGYIGAELLMARIAYEACEAMDANTPFAIFGGDMGEFLEKAQSRRAKAGLCLFSGVDRLSYNGEQDPYDLAEKIELCLEDDGAVIVGGVLEDFDKKFSVIDSFFEIDEVLRGEYPSEFRIYKKRRD